MKKLIVFLFLVLLFTLGACASPLPIPYGVWHSEDPNITLIIDREHATVLYDTSGFILSRNVFPGTYEKDGEIIDIVIGFLESRNTFGIQSASIETISGLARADRVSQDCV